MIKTPRIPMNRLAVALGLALAAMGAQAADIASATANLSSLRYRLIDLDLNDGITPTLSVAGNLTVSGYTFVKNESGFPDTNPLDANNIATAPWFSSGTISWASSALGASGTLSNGASTSVRLNSDSLLANKYAESNTSSSTFQSYDQDGVLRYTTATTTYDHRSTSERQSAEAVAEQLMVPVTDSDGNFAYYTQAPNLTLSANTLLVIEGTLSLSVKANSESFATAIDSALSPAASAYKSTSGFVTASAGVGISPELNTSILPGGSTHDQDQSTYQALTQSLSFTTDVVTRDWAPYDPDALPQTQLVGSDAKAFAITFANTSQSDLQAYLSVRVAAESYASADVSQEVTTLVYGDRVPETPVVPPTPPVPGIPEPSTYALMGLGLVGIALASRRQRPTKQA